MIRQSGKVERILKTTQDMQKGILERGQNVGLVNLGCARNLVDSQEIVGLLKREGHRFVDLEHADVAIVNTCSFIDDAKRESIDTILDLIELKNQGKLKKVVVAGCLAQRYGQELAKEFPEIDAIVGVPQFSKTQVPEQVYLTPQHFAYVKICESCYNQCSFCVIPKIKGKFVSRQIESVLSEVEALDAKGVKEINLIGQDITAYGMDLYREYSLARLLKAMVKVTNNIQWIRLLYAFPAHMTDELIDTIASEEKICNYIDMPLQHISDQLLASMNRNISTQGTYDLLGKIRSRIPAVHLRTTFIVGLPGERQEDFDELLAFVKQSRFEKLGVFVYSREEGTEAYDMPGQIAEQTKRRRMSTLMAVQKGISRDIQERFVGMSLRVMIERREKGQEGIYQGRTEYDAPDVDGIIYVHSKKALQAGDFVDVKVVDAMEYDLVGEAE